MNKKWNIWVYFLKKDQLSILFYWKLKSPQSQHQTSSSIMSEMTFSHIDENIVWLFQARLLHSFVISIYLYSIVTWWPITDYSHQHGRHEKENNPYDFAQENDFILCVWNVEHWVCGFYFMSPSCWGLKTMQDLRVWKLRFYLFWTLVLHLALHRKKKSEGICAVGITHLQQLERTGLLECYKEPTYSKHGIKRYSWTAVSF